jgi:CRP/FNR family transcriptional regulator, cyclic AMP receptor protein
MVRGMPPRIADLRTIPLWKGFSDDDLAEIAALFEPVVTGTAPLFDVGEPARAIYLLTGGEVALDWPGDDHYRLRPPALIGELGALTGLARGSKAVPAPGAEVWRVDAAAVQRFLADNQDLGVRFLVNLLELVADKVQRDQRRLSDMRTNLVRTQKELKRLRDVVLEAPESEVSAPIHDGLDRLITTNRRVNYRVAPPVALASTLRLEAGKAPVAELSRTHVTAVWPKEPPAPGTWLSGVLDLAGTEIPVSGHVIRRTDHGATFELDLLIDEYAAIFEGYLTRVQLLDILA